MARKDWIDHRSEPLTAGELPLAVKRIVAMEAHEYAVHADFDRDEVPVIEHGSRLNVYVPETLLSLTPESDAEIESKLDRNVARTQRVAVHPYDDAPDPAL